MLIAICNEKARSKNILPTVREIKEKFIGWTLDIENSLNRKINGSSDHGMITIEYKPINNLVLYLVLTLK